ncbi:MAG: hypothetical protein DMF11_14165 [Verrucomicrobia bacterium]|nr:MAG: hypothetical protein DMF11_14165 [Verrucomicrobiota bacterium]
MSLLFSKSAVECGNLALQGTQLNESPADRLLKNTPQLVRSSAFRRFPSEPRKRGTPNVVIDSRFCLRIDRLDGP